MILNVIGYDGFTNVNDKPDTDTNSSSKAKSNNRPKAKGISTESHEQAPAELKRKQPPSGGQLAKRPRVLTGGSAAQAAVGKIEKFLLARVQPPASAQQLVNGKAAGSKLKVQRGQELKAQKIQRGQELKAQKIQRGQELKTQKVQQRQEQKVQKIQQVQEPKTQKIQRVQELKAQKIQQRQELKVQKIQQGRELKAQKIQRGQEQPKTQKLRDEQSKDEQQQQQPERESDRTQADWSVVSDCLLEEVRDIKKLVKESADLGARDASIFSDEAIKDNKELHPYLVSHLTEKLQLQHFTKVQAEVIPLMLAGHDLLIKSQTGSGKSLAFCVPVVQLLQSEQPALSRSSGLRALVLSPTRELAQQTHELLTSLLRPFVRIVSGLLVGGVKRKAQKASLRRGLNVAVATPRRLLDHMRHSSGLRLQDVRLLVIDEADRLQELGFERDVASVVEALAAEGRRPQTALCSATLGEGVERLAGLSLLRPRRVAEEAAIPASIRHFAAAPPTKLRLKSLLGFLRLLAADGLKAALFLPTQASVDFHRELLALLLGEELVGRLHGSMQHRDRMDEFRRFADGDGLLLLTTDVAARGVELQRLQWVVQYGCAGQPGQYCHRVGRLARLGVAGRSLLLLSPAEAPPYLRLLHDEAGVRCSLLPLQQLLDCAPDTFGHLADTVARDERLKRLAEEAFVSTLRAYASCTGQLRGVFAFKALHLGHVAASFCLSDAPSDISNRVRRRASAAREQDAAGTKNLPAANAKRPVAVAAAPAAAAPAASAAGRRTSKAVGGQRIRQRAADRMSEFASGL